MVTGIETAGLVLAVLPLVISALESYKAGLQTINRLYHSEAQLRALIRTLKVQRSKYRSNLQKLIQAAAPDLCIQDIPEDFSDPVWRGGLNAQAKAYLGDRYESFQIVVEDYQEYIREIARKLRHINRPRTAGKTDLHALLVGNPSQNGTFTWVKKIDFTMKDKDLKLLTKKLDDSNLTLSSFINDSDMLERLALQPTDSQRARALSDVMRKIRLQADYLYAAICKARHPGCSASHRVMLHLEDRMPVKGGSRLGSTTTAEHTVKFCLSIAWQSQDPSCSPCWHQAVVTVSQASSAHQVNVEDLCRLIDSAEQLNHAVRFHLRDDTLLRFYNPQEKIQPPQREMETTTLEQLLKPGSGTKLQPKDSTTLALKLASSLLQLNFTFWLERRWTKSEISFFRLRNPSVTYLSQPLLQQDFQAQAAPSPALRNATAIKDILFEFGILLMEIWTQVSFEDWMTQHGETCQDDSYYARLRPAMMRYDQEKDFFPLKYREVISRCLGRNFEGYNMSWDDQRFREAVCINIIEPLQETCEIW